MVEEKTIRLSQVARKLNVATTTITTYLLEKGFRIENKPNTKITLEQYQILAEEFAESAMDKEEAAELVIGQSYEKEPKVVTKQQEQFKYTPPKQEQPEIEIKVDSEPVSIVVPTPAIEVEKEEEDQVVPPTEALVEEVATSIIAPPEEEIDEKEKENEQEPEKEIIPDQPQVLLPKGPEKIGFINPYELQGVTVLGKIELAEKKEPKKFQQVASSDLDKKNKKRPRKRVTSPSEPTTSAPKREDSNRDNNRYKPKSKTPNKLPETTKPSVSEKEIQDQIKSTLAKLGGNKNIASRAKYRREKRSLFAEEQKEERLQADRAAKKLQVTEFIAASDLASLMGVSINELLSTCMNLGMLVSINQRLDAEAITIIADEFGYQVEFTDIKTQEVEEEEESDPKDLVERAPIVTIMGHVDHGKTSLLDYIRNTQITKTEAGGITQHIGAYEVVTESGKHIAFLDTPGHEAFTAMRARGAKLTDIAIIVIAADDGVRPQTKEAINHAKLAGVPIIIAINKMDKPQANPEKVKEELAHLNILVEDWGGKYQSQGVSAISGEGVKELLEKILFEAELLELKTNPHRKARGTVIEASLDQGRGYLATVMVQEGTLGIGDVVLAGAYYGKIKAMFNYQGKSIKQAGPSTPMQILGLNGAPQAGDLFRATNTEKQARDIATQRQQILREQGFRTKTHITLDEIGRRLAIGNFKELNIILKGDVDGSVEALSDSLLKLSTEEIKVTILHKGVGAIVESDILLAAASDAIIIGFQVRPTPPVRKLAEKEGIEIRLYSIIYDAINDIKDAMEGMLAPTIEEIITGSAAVREVFKITGTGTVAGCYVTEGYIKKNNSVRVIRDGIVIYTGSIKHLKHFKEEMQQVKTGFECGISISNFNDLKVNDIIEGFEQKEVERKL
jgi:translation initiation factor IF-2